MKNLKIICVWVGCFLFSSCSCLRVFTGILLDRNTHQPIKSADVQVVNKGYFRQFESDSTGYFEAYLQGGCKCPRIQLQIKADGYNVLEAREPRKRDTVVLYMEKLNSFTPYLEKNDRYGYADLGEK